MAHADKHTETITTTTFKLELSEKEAAALYDVLYRHVGGRPTTSGEVLNRITGALFNAGVSRDIVFRNVNPHTTNTYAVLQEIAPE